MFVSTFGYLEFSLRRARHSLLVDRADDDTRAVLLGKFKHLRKARLAVLVVRRIQNALTACVLQTGFHLLPFSRIEHQRNLDVCHQPRGEFVHIFLAITPHEINIDVEHVRAFAFLFARERDEAVPVFGVQQVAHLL